MSDSERERVGYARDRSRPFDVVLWGATGFTGRLVAEYLLRERAAGNNVRLALAGRNRTRLEQVRDALSTVRDRARDLPIVEGDSFDRSSLDAIAAQASVVCSTVGPFAKYGAELVAACVAHGTDYCDLTGETQFVRRMIDAHHEAARASGTRIVHCCGFDSIPSDIGTLLVQNRAHERFGGPVREIRNIVGPMRGGLSGGTVASMMAFLDEARADRAIRRLVADPYALNPEGERNGPDDGDQTRPLFDSEIGTWTAPFVMAAINTRVVRRSNALLGYRYGRDFRYSEAVRCGPGGRGRLAATAVAGALASAVAVGSQPLLRRVFEKTLLPAPGQGPNEERRKKGRFRMTLLGRGADGGGEAARVRGRVEGFSDPGYGETAKMLGESALCLALDGAELDTPGGVLTPSVAMGTRLADRLREAGMVLSATEL